jgi:hypothetical protein
MSQKIYVFSYVIPVLSTRPAKKSFYAESLEDAWEQMYDWVDKQELAMTDIQFDKSID